MASLVQWEDASVRCGEKIKQNHKREASRRFWGCANVRKQDSPTVVVSYPCSWGPRRRRKAVACVQDCILSDFQLLRWGWGLVRGWETVAFTPFLGTEEEWRNQSCRPLRDECKTELWRSLAILLSKAPISLGLFSSSSNTISMDSPTLVSSGGRRA